MESKPQKSMSPPSLTINALVSDGNMRFVGPAASATTDNIRHDYRSRMVLGAMAREAMELAIDEEVVNDTEDKAVNTVETMNAADENKSPFVAVFTFSKSMENEEDDLCPLSSPTAQSVRVPSAVSSQGMSGVSSLAFELNSFENSFSKLQSQFDDANKCAPGSISERLQEEMSGLKKRIFPLIRPRDRKSVV